MLHPVPMEPMASAADLTTEAHATQAVRADRAMARVELSSLLSSADHNQAEQLVLPLLVLLPLWRATQAMTAAALAASRMPRPGVKLRGLDERQNIHLLRIT